MSKQRPGETEPQLTAAYVIVAVLGIFFLFVFYLAMIGPGRGRKTAAPTSGALETAAEQLFERLAEDAAASAPLPTRDGKGALPSVLHPHPDQAFESRRRDGVFGNVVVFSTGPAGAADSPEGLLLADQFRLVAYRVEGDGGLVVRRVYPAFASTNPVEYNAAIQSRTLRLDPEALSGAIQEEVVLSAPRPAWTDIQIGVVYPVAFDDGGTGSEMDLNVIFTEYPNGDRTKAPVVVSRRVAVPFKS